MRFRIRDRFNSGSGFCKVPFVTEKSIDNHNTTNVTYIDNFHTDVVNVSEGNSRENRALTREIFIKLGD